MPLNIDIAFKWGKKKPPPPPGDDKKDPPPKTPTSTTTTTTTCSTADATTTTPTKTTTTPCETSKAAKTKYDSVKTGSVEESKVPPPPLRTEKTQLDSVSAPKDDRTKKVTKQKEPKAVIPQKNETIKPKEDEKKKEIAKKKESVKETSDESSTESEDSEASSSAASAESLTTAKSTNEKLKQPIVATTPQKVQSPNTLAEKSLIPRRVVLFRHAERMDRVFPSWIRQANINGSYRPYNSNQPRTLPKRRGGLAAYDSDPPITEVGKHIAQMAGKAIKQSQHKINAIYSSPSLRCIETAQIIAKEIGETSNLKIKIEPGLFDWYTFYESAPIFMTTAELLDAGFDVSKDYRPIISKETLMKEFYNETKNNYYRRGQDVIQKILLSTMGKVIIVAHATTLDSSSRALLNLSKSIPATHHLDHLADRYPYCTSVVIEQIQESGQWRLGKSLLPITFVSQTTKFDRSFMLRK